MAKVTKWDFLNACSHTQWRATLVIKESMEKALGLERREISVGQMFVFVEKLEDEGFIETRQTPDTDGTRGGRPKLEMRITKGGIRARHDAQQEQNEDLSGTGLKPA